MAVEAATVVSATPFWSLHSASPSASRLPLRHPSATTFSRALCDSPPSASPLPPQFPLRHSSLFQPYQKHKSRREMLRRKESGGPHNGQCRVSGPGPIRASAQSSASTDLEPAPSELKSASPVEADPPCDVIPSVSVVAVVGADARSPFGDATWLEVMEHMAKRVSWIDPAVEVLVLPSTSLETLNQQSSEALKTADVVLGVAIGRSDPKVGEELLILAKDQGTVIFLDSAPELEQQTVLGGVRVDQIPSPLLALARTGIWQQGSQAIKTAELVRTAWSRRKADDVWFSVLALVNALVKPVEELKSLRATGLDSVFCMVRNCSTEISACLNDPNCRAAIQCLNSCAPTDQVCSYRCIVSYESPQLEAFSLCTLQKHSCLGLSAQPRTLPVVHPMDTFRGTPLTHEVAEGIFTGWLGQLQSSWRVAAGQNAAYDQFPCQFQIFYKGKAKGSFWYDPVFKVRKFNGDVVWRRRHYRVRRGKDPGSFIFSVLDNGVISEEFWKIADATDDLSWGLFYYSGAAKAAGQAYTGAVLVTPDGKWPQRSEHERLTGALGKCGIKEWEMYQVDNSNCTDPPLGLPADAPEQSALL